MNARIGWIGLGSMGLPMAQRILAAGWPLTVWARRPQAAQTLRDAGAVWAPDPATLAQGSTLIVTMLRGSDDVRQVYQALLPSLHAGTRVVDMSTAAPAVAGPLAAALQARQVRWLDCPVTGGVAGARNGTLTLFAGADAAALQDYRALLELLGQRIVTCGGTGDGYRTKLINQVMMAGALLGVAEGAAMARAAGMGGAQLLEALRGGSASGWMFDAYAQRMVEGDRAVGFTLAMLRKDLQLALQAAGELGMPGVLVLRHALAVVDSACERHGPQAGVQSLAWAG